MSHSWGYTNENGPATWAKRLDIKVGNKQSPIDIVKANAVFDESLKSLKFSYPSFENAKLENNGHTVEFSPTGGNTSEACCGPVTNKYKLAQFHFHWGKNNDVGSEHIVDGIPYSGELHLVHYNTDLYSSAAEALTKKNGLMVFGMFLKVGHHENAALKPITDQVPAIHKYGASVTLNEPFNPHSVFPESLHYWSYPGSLTTPPLSESVTWVVFENAISVSSEQVASFREIQASDGSCVCENFRPTQDLNGRVVKASFKHGHAGGHGHGH